MKRTGIVFAASIMAISLVLGGCTTAAKETSEETTETEVTTTTTTEETTASETEESKSDDGVGDEKIVKTKTTYEIDSSMDEYVLTKTEEFNEKGLIVSSSYRSRSTPYEDFGVTTYTYEYNGNTVKRTETKPDQTVKVMQYEYDDDGNTVKQITHSAGEIVYVDEFEWDADGNLLVVILTVDHGDSYEIMRTEYEYY